MEGIIIAKHAKGEKKAKGERVVFTVKQKFQRGSRVPSYPL